MCREIVENVLSGMKAGFKSILNSQHPFEKEKLKGGLMLKKSFLILLFAAVSILGATGSLSAQDCDDELVIGDMQPLSGTAASAGEQTHRGVVLAAKHYNEGSHPLNSTPCFNVAGKTYKLKTVVYDHLYTSEGAVAAANRLVFQDKTKYVVGTYGSGPSIAAVDAVYTPNKIIHLATGWAPKVLGMDKPYTYRLGPTGREYGHAFWQWATEGGAPNIKKVAMLLANDEAGRGNAPREMAVMEQYGIESVANEYWDVGQMDFYPQLTRAMAAKPDLMYIHAGPVEEGLMVKQLRELGWEGPIRGLCPQLKNSFKIAGGPELFEGMYCNFGLDWDAGPPYVTKEMERFRDAYRADYPGEEPTLQVLSVYDATVGLLEAMKMAGTVDDSVKVNYVFQNFNWMLSLGAMSSWGGKESSGRAAQVVQPILISQIRNGKIIAVGNPIVPIP